MPGKKNLRKKAQPVIPEKKVPLDAGWKSMINWFCLLVLVLPVLISFKTMDPVISIRYIFLSFFCLLFVAYFFIIRKTKFGLSFTSSFKAFFILAISYCGWSVICMFLATNIATALYEVLRQMLNVILLFLIVIAIRLEGYRVLKLCKAALILSLIQSLVGILQYLGIAFNDLPGAFNPYGLMANRTLFGSAQVLLLPFVMFVLFNASKWWKYISVLALICIIISIIISQARSAWLATFGLVVTASVLIFIFHRQYRKKLLIGILAGISGIVIIVTLLIITNRNSSFLTSLKERAISLFRPSTDQTTSLAARLVNWRVTMDLINDHKIFGVGSGNWKLDIPLYGSKVMVWNDAKTLPSRPHNVYLQVTSETGIPGAIMFFGTWLLVIIAGFKIIRSTTLDDVRFLTILMVSGLIALGIDSMISFPTERIEHALYLVLMEGVILGFYSYHAKPGRAISNKLLFLLLFIIAFNLFVGYKKYNFELHGNLAKLYRVEHRNEEVLEEVEKGKSNFVTIDPNGDPLEIHSSSAYIELNNYEEALKEIKIARNYHPNSARVYTTMGVVYASMKQYDNAIKSYIHALQLAPRYETAMKNLGVVYFATGNYKECIEMLGRVFIQDSQYLLNVFAEAKKNIGE